LNRAPSIFRALLFGEIASGRLSTPSTERDSCWILRHQSTFIMASVEVIRSGEKLVENKANKVFLFC
jgi:hypothetical protein